jgi:acetylornithine deacetylase/succinyl-diaminopimelate desuccinylase-like protein
MLAALAAASEPPAHVARWRAQVDWEASQAETVALLSAYLQVDTRNPPGMEEVGASFLGARLDAEGIPWALLPHSEGRASLVARLNATNPTAGPLCLVSHLDVVGWEDERWPADRGPLSGAIVEGSIWGRGALDMKGMGALELQTMILLKRLQVPLSRDVVLLALADEEVANVGAREAVDRYWDQIGCSHAINEGGLGVKDAIFDGESVHGVSVAEKGILWVELIATGRAGHGSTPYPGEAPDRLRDAMVAIDRMRARPVFDETMLDLLDAIGRTHGGATGAVLRSPFLVRTLARKKLMNEPATRAILTDTIHLTGVYGAVAPNVVPSEARAMYDCRLRPGTTPGAMLERLREATAHVDGVRFEVISAAESSASPTDDPLFRALVRYAVEGRPAAAAGPLLSVGYTDSMDLRRKGVRAYGYVPFEVTAEDAETMHGHGERVPVSEVGSGLERLFSVVVDVAAAP